MSHRVGFVGLGNMGSRMSARLVEAGYEVVGFDPGRHGSDGVVSSWASTLADVASSNIVLMSLPDRVVVEKVLWGTSGEVGLLEHLRSGQIIVDMTTSAPETTKRAATECDQRDVRFLDVGISGGAKGAESGQLTFMVGGSTEALETARAILSVLATTIEHVGASGSGHVLKILNNFLNAMNLSASAEVLVAAKAAGLDVAQALRVINQSSGSNWATENRFPHIIEGDYLEGGLSSQLMLKDIQLYVDLVAQVGVPSLHASGPIAAFGSAIQRGYGDDISNRVVDAIGDMAGGIRLPSTGHN